MGTEHGRPDKAVILAAGKGERLRPLTETRPKVMLPVANKPLLQRNLEQLAGLVEEVILVVGYRSDVIRGHFGSSFGGMRIRYVTQREQLGTGHAVMQSERLLGGRFLLMMGDNLYSRRDIEGCMLHDNSILVRRVENPRIFGVCTVKNGLLEGIVEKPRKPVTNLANAGLYVLDPGVFAHEQRKTERGEFEIVDSLNQMCGDGKHIHALEASDFDYVTYPWDLLRINETILRKEGASIDPGAVIGKRTVIEGPVAVGRGAELKDCVIRQYTSIGDGAAIGNYVEIKNSIIMDGTKIPHLSYVGDSLIGSNCNLGAGTKIANLRFDDREVRVKIMGEYVSTGRRKMGCVMGDNVKTGINSSILPGALLRPGTLANPGSVLK